MGGDIRRKALIRSKCPDLVQSRGNALEKRKAFLTFPIGQVKGKTKIYFDRKDVVDMKQAQSQTPWWIQSLNGQLLSPAEAHVLELVFLCSKHGCCMPLAKQAKRLQLSKRHVRRCHNRLQELLLEREYVVFGSVKRYHPVRWISRSDWQSARSNETSKDMEDIMSAKSVRESKDKPTKCRLYSLSQVAVVADATRVSLPQTPAGLTNRCSGRAADSPPTREAKDGFLWRVIYSNSLSKLLEAEHPRDQAERLAKIKTDHYIAKRKAEREKIMVQKNSQGQKK